MTVSIDTTKTDSQGRFIHSGTGAVVRTVQKVLRDGKVNLKNFQDGLEHGDDATVALQLAMDAINDEGHGTLEIDGTYYLGDEITWHDSVSIEGMGWRLDGTDFFTPVGSGFMLESNSALGSSKGLLRAKSLTGGTSRRHSGEMRKLFIHGNGDTNGGTGGGGTIGLVVDGVRELHLDTVAFFRCSGPAIKTVTTSGSPNGLRVRMSSFRFNYDHGLYLLGGEHQLADNYIGNNSGCGVFSVAGSLSVTGNIIADSTLDGIYVQDSWAGTDICGNIIQDNYRNGIQIASSGSAIRYVNVTGNDIYDNGLNDALALTDRCGIKWATSLLTVATCSGNTIGNRREAGDSEHPLVSPSQQYGMYFSSALTRVKGSGNTIANNVTANVLKAHDKNFGAEFSGSGDVYTMTTYEEGTYAPALAFGGASVDMTYGTQLAAWTKSGNTIAINGAIILTAKGSSTGAATLSLPVASTHYAAVTLRGNVLGATVNTAYIQGMISPGGSTIALGRLTGGNNTALLDTDFSNTSSIVFNVTYRF
jgi:hypothetical protein